MSNGNTIVLIGLLFAVIFASGIWLSRSARPLGSLKLNFHKLIALAVGIFVLITALQVNEAHALSGIELPVVVVTGLLFLCTGVTGGLASIDKPMPPVVTTLHHVAPYLTLISTAATLYLLLIV